LGRPTLPTLSEALSSLMAEETRLKTLTANSPMSQHSVLAVPPVSVQVAAPVTSQGTPCSHCGRKNHPDERCFKKYPHLLAEMRARRAVSHRGPPAASSDIQAVATAPQFQQSVPHFQQQSSSNISVPVSAYMSASSTSNPGTAFWVLDLGASFHMTSNSSRLDSCQPITNTCCVQTADGNLCTVTHQGNLITSQFAVSDVALVPKLSMNLISIGQLADLNCVIGYDDTSCFIQDR
ncbi:hypothetical protein BAE44_0004923, partial [Dichanthelium oligosanthes]